MKNTSLSFIIYFILPSIVLLSSCQKGTEIKGTGYGKLTVESTFDSQAKDLLVKVDGETKATLTATNSNSVGQIIVAEGPHRVSLVSTENQTVLKDTTIQFETAKTSTLPRFWNKGNVLLFDDYDPTKMPKPANGNILLRFITTGLSLPDDIRIEIVASYRSGRNSLKVTSGKTILHVSKNVFTDYIELPDWRTLIPAGTAGFYTVEAYDNATNAKIIGVGTTVGSLIYLNGNNTVFIPNAVFSLAIESATATSTIFSKSL